MIQGVHAQTVAFVGLEHATEVLQVGLWGSSARGRSNHAEMHLIGSPRRRVVVRVGGIRKQGKTTVCNLQLETVAEKLQPVLRGTLEFSSAKDRTQIRLEGSAAARLADGPNRVSTNDVRRIGNDYARQVVDEVAARVEALAGKRAGSESFARVK